MGQRNGRRLVDGLNSELPESIVDPGPTLTVSLAGLITEGANSVLGRSVPCGGAGSRSGDRGAGIVRDGDIAHAVVEGKYSHSPGCINVRVVIDEHVAEDGGRRRVGSAKAIVTGLDSAPGSLPVLGGVAPDLMVP